MNYAEGFDNGYGEAAAPRDAEIAKQRARIATLEAALAELNMDFDTVASAGEQMAARLNAAEAERDRLREALEEVLRLTNERYPAAKIAREALQPKEQS